MPKLFVATNGLSVWSSDDLGKTISRMPSSTGLYSGSRVWAFATHPSRPDELLAGTDSGLYRLNINDRHWMLLSFPMDGVGLITAIAYQPGNADVIYAGTQPAGMFRSLDGGKTWNWLAADMKPFTNSGFFLGEGVARETVSPVKHWMRVTQILVDERDENLVWASVEIDAVWRTCDGGNTWKRCSEGFSNEDIHGLAVTYHNGRVVHATTAAGLYASHDDGETWTNTPINSARQYTRSIAVNPKGSSVIFATNGDGPPGNWGKLFRSDDWGATWNLAPFPGNVESSLYFLAFNPADPNLIFAAATLGQIYVSEDGGLRWTALQRRLGEIRDIAWVPD